MQLYFNDRYECHSFLDGIAPIHTNMTITNRVKITISPLRLHAASSVRIPISTHSFRTLYLSSPRLCFFIVISLDLSVDREDSLTS